MKQTHAPRLDWLDQARGIALLAMTCYHFTWDLFSLGLTDLNPVSTMWLAWSAKGIAATFLLLSGLALALAHQSRILWRKVLVRSLTLGGAASLVSLGSYFLFPASWIAFGILHHMALAGVIGLLFLRLPPFALIGLALLCLLLPDFAKHDVFNSAPWLFLGLSTIIAPANDYVPLLPWFGFVLLGMALPKLWPVLQHHSPAPQPSRPLRLIGLMGRHSLIYYLIHQPVLLGLLNLLIAVGVLMPAATTRAHFTQACERDCSFDQGDEALCRRICQCIYEEVQKTPNLLNTAPADMTADQEQKLRSAIKQCR